MYQERAVFFLDILGFGEKVEKAADDSVLMKKISDSLSLIASLPNAQNSTSTGFLISLLKGKSLPEADVQVLTFSDSLVISVSCEQPEAVATLLTVVQRVQYELLKVGLLSRGGGDIGSLTHKPNGIMFGPAFNSAYDLENKLAKNPRILVGQNYIDFLEKFGFDDAELIESELLTSYPDGPFGIDSYSWVNTVMNKGEIGILKKFISDVDQEIKNHRYEPSVYGKLEWHKKQMVKAAKASDKYDQYADRLPI